MRKEIKIGRHVISEDSPVYIVAEMSANHNMDYERALKIIDAAAEAGADAVKIQTYTADTITLDCDNAYFQIHHGTLWDGTTMHQLYQSAYTPWEWQADLKKYAAEKGLDLFSSPFDLTAVDFLEEIHMPAYKVASFEINDIPFIRKIARTGKPVIISTGIAHLEDIDLAVRTCLEEGNDQIILLKCTSAYPSLYEDMNIRTIPNMAQTFGCIGGLSDHSMGSAVAAAAVALGAKVIEKHLTLRRSDGGPDSAFSMEAQEFKEMCEQIRIVEKALGRVTYDLSLMQRSERDFGRSLFVVRDVQAGEPFTPENVRSIRPAYGMHTKHYEEILGKKASCDIAKGTPLSWELVKFGE